jgi:hypothetical protein
MLLNSASRSTFYLAHVIEQVSNRLQTPNLFKQTHCQKYSQQLPTDEKNVPSRRLSKLSRNNKICRDDAILRENFRRITKPCAFYYICENMSVAGMVSCRYRFLVYRDSGVAPRFCGRLHWLHYSNTT